MLTNSELLQAVKAAFEERDMLRDYAALLEQDKLTLQLSIDDLRLKLGCAIERGNVLRDRVHKIWEMTVETGDELAVLSGWEPYEAPEDLDEALDDADYVNSLADAEND